MKMNLGIAFFAILLAGCATNAPPPVEPKPFVFGQPTAAEIAASEAANEGAHTSKNPTPSGPESSGPSVENGDGPLNGGPLAPTPPPAIAIAQNVTFAAFLDDAVRQKVLSPNDAAIFRQVLSVVPSLDTQLVTNLSAGGGSISADMEFIGNKWSFIGYTGGGLDSTFVGFSPSTELTFADMFSPLSIGGANPGSMMDVLSPNEQVYILAASDIKLKQSGIPNAVKTVTNRFMSDPHDDKGGKYLEVPAGLTQYGMFDLGDLEILADAIEFLGGKSGEVHTSATFNANLFQSIMEGKLEEPELVMKAYLPKFRPSIGGYVELPVDFGFQLRATLSSGGMDKDESPDGKKVPLGVTLGLTGTSKMKIEGQQVNVSLAADVKQTLGAPEFTVTGTVFDGEPWKGAFGLDWLTIQDYRMTFGQEADSVKMGLGGLTTIGSKNFDTYASVAVAAKTAGFPIPERIELEIDDGDDKVGSLSLHDFMSIFVEMMKATGQNNVSLPDGFPNISLTGTEVGQGPKLALALKASGEAGIDLSGKLNVLGQDIATIDRAFIQASEGVEIKARTEKIQVGPIAFPHGEADIFLRRPGKDESLKFPHIAIKTSGASFLGSKNELQLLMKKDQFEVSSLQDYGSLMKFKLKASTGKPINSLEELANVDLFLDSSFSTDPLAYIRNEGKQAARAAFDFIRVDTGPAKRDVASARADVDSLDRQISSLKRTIESERASKERDLNSAIAEVSKLQGDINSLQSDINELNSKRWKNFLGVICTVGCPELFAEVVALESAKTGAQGLKATADGALRLARTAVNETTGIDPRLLTLQGSQQAAYAGLEIAEASLDALDGANRALDSAINAMDKIDVLALEESRIRGSLRSLVNGNPMVLDLRLRIFGQRLQQRLAFSTTDWEFNASQIEVIGLKIVAQGLKEILRGTDIVPDSVLDEIDGIYRSKQRAVDNHVNRALRASGMN